MKETIAIIGLGLMGGSLAKRIKAFRPDISIIGYDEERDVILSAIDLKIIDTGYMKVNQDINKAQFIVIATPPFVFPQVLAQLSEFNLNPQVVITDLLSVKGCCETWIKEAGLIKAYVGGHPLCGQEKSGFNNSSQQIFDQGLYCLMEANEDNQEAFQKWETLIESLAIKTMVLSPLAHDDLMAYVSHMPHAISYMMSHLALNLNDVPTLGKSFKEMTRISKSSAHLWTDIFVLNRHPLLQVLKEMKHEILYLEGLLEGKDKSALFHYLNETQTSRVNKELEEVC